MLDTVSCFMYGSVKNSPARIFPSIADLNRTGTVFRNPVQSVALI
jgi:hypothetical protein